MKINNQAQYIDMLLILNPSTRMYTIHAVKHESNQQILIDSQQIPLEKKPI